MPAIQRPQGSDKSLLYSDVTLSILRANSKLDVIKILEDKLNKIFSDIENNSIDINTQKKQYKDIVEFIETIEKSNLLERDVEGLQLLNQFKSVAQHKIAEILKKQTRDTSISMLVPTISSTSPDENSEFSLITSTTVLLRGGYANILTQDMEDVINSTKACRKNPNTETLTEVINANLEWIESLEIPFTQSSNIKNIINEVLKDTEILNKILRENARNRSEREVADKFEEKIALAQLKHSLKDKYVKSRTLEQSNSHQRTKSMSL